ncbi:hypothetical protein ACPPVU_22965 [Mucilaginibacter sp. McL0603]|uniref:hypothetical protein n=1 Tax=Mucilaginibacter sp. McL0603 TaxID=3415670 RepID=UPI003CEE14E3
MRKITAIVCGLILLGFVGTCVYFVGGVSATYPPIKEYKFSGSIEQIGQFLQFFSESNPYLTYKISIRDSSNLDVSYRDIEIKLKDSSKNFSYALVCEENDDKSETIIKLVDAFNETNNIGGYSIESQGVKELLKHFESDFIIPFQKSEHIVISPQSIGFWEKIY